MNFQTTEPTPWSQLNSVSRLQYLEKNKGRIRAVMEASGFAFPEERWEQIKRNAVRDMHDYTRKEQWRQSHFGVSTFKNVKVSCRPSHALPSLQQFSFRRKKPF